MKLRQSRSAPPPAEGMAITRASASNLALAFVLLPRPTREAMATLYAFCRQVDDVADDEAVPVAERRARLAAWRADVRRAGEGGQPEFPVSRELQPVIARHHIPLRLFDDLIRGVEMDLDTRRYATWEELEVYCYHVASVVGLLSIEIFGYQHPATRDYAIHLGQALQLTNILRDVREDALRGRIYLPQCELAAHGVPESDLLKLTFSPRFTALATAVAARARHHYRLAQATLPAADRRAMIAAELMGAVYWRLLGQMERRQFNVFGSRPVRVSKPAKLYLIFRTWLRIATGSRCPNYGDSSPGLNPKSAT